MRISYSQVDNFLSCPRKWKEAPRVETRQMRVGSLIHRALEGHIKNGCIMEDALKHAILNEDISEQMDAMSLLRNFDLPKGDIIGLEKRFEFPLKEHSVSGVVDRIESYDFDIVISDYKSGGWLPTINDVKRNLQPAIYMISESQATHFRYYFLKFNKSLELERDNVWLDEVKEILYDTACKMKIVREMHIGEAPATPNKFCKWCSLYSRCLEELT